MRLEEAVNNANGALQIQRDKMSRWIYYRVHIIDNRFAILIYADSPDQKQNDAVITAVKSMEAVEGICILTAIAMVQRYEPEDWMACRLIYGNLADL